MNKDIKLLIENIFQREGARELLKRSKAEEIDAQIRKMYLYHPKTREELEYNIIECFKNEIDLISIDVSEIDDFEDLFMYNNDYPSEHRLGKYIVDHKITSIDISGWNINLDADLDFIFYKSTLKEVGLPVALRKMGQMMFCGSNLTSVTIPDSVTEIDWGTFDACSGLTSVTIPNSVMRIGWNAFRDCTGLTSVTIPDLVTEIDCGAFSGCTGLANIVVLEGNKVYDSRNNCNAIIETKSNYLISGCKNTVIPDSVTAIGEDAFRGCTGLTSVTIPNSVTSIGKNAFYRCGLLTNVTIPNSVTEIGARAFFYCRNLKTIYVDNVKTFNSRFSKRFFDIFAYNVLIKNKKYKPK